MNCVALGGFVQEIIDEFEFNIDASSADVRKLLQENVMIFDISTYKLEDSKNKDHINADWKCMVKNIVGRLIIQNPDVIVLSLGYNSNMLAKDLVSDGILDNNQLICTGHPSPKATTSNFRGCGCFRKVNEMLFQKGDLPVRFGVIFT
jgi:uracil DNA glycosylase